MAEHFVLGISTSSGIAQVCALAMHEESSQAFKTQAQPLLGEWAQAPVLFAYEITDYKQQSLELLPLLLKHMAETGLTGDHCKGIACNIGPGGFTSLRTACGVAQGLATAWSCGVVPVSSFECMAAEYALRGGQLNQPLVCYADARLQEFYAAALLWAPGPSTQSSFKTLHQPCQVKANLLDVQSFTDSVVNLLEPNDACVNSLHAPLALIEQSALSILEDSGFDLAGMHYQQVNPGAHGLAALGVRAAMAGELQEPFALQPLYVREKVAQTTSERMAARNVGL